LGEDEFDLKRYANNSCQSAIVTQKTNTEIKVIYAKHTFRTRCYFQILANFTLFEEFAQK